MEKWSEWEFFICLAKVWIEPMAKNIELVDLWGSEKKRSCRAGHAKFLRKGIQVQTSDKNKDTFDGIKYGMSVSISNCFFDGMRTCLIWHRILHAQMCRGLIRIEQDTALATTNSQRRDALIEWKGTYSFGIDCNSPEKTTRQYKQSIQIRSRLWHKEDKM